MDILLIILNFTTITINFIIFICYVEGNIISKDTLQFNEDIGKNHLNNFLHKHVFPDICTFS